MSINELLTESKVFANRSVLSPHYVPKKLTFREKEINLIERALAPALKGEKGRNLFIYGKTGTGKTTCTMYVANEIKDLPNAHAYISYVNCRMYNSRYRVLNKIINDHIPSYAKRGFGTINLYERLTDWVEEENKILIAALDEIDVVKDLDDLIYTLTRINSELKSGGVSIVGISNKVSFKDDLDPRSLSTLYENELVFSPYNAKELYAIIKERADQGFKKGILEDEIIHYISAGCAKEGGDARLALKVLTKAGELAEDRSLPRITMKEAEEAMRISEDEVVFDLISTLPEHQKLVLYSVVLLTLGGGSYKKLTDGTDTYLFSGEVYNRYKSISQSIHKEPKSERWYRKYLSELAMQGLIAAYESGKGIRGHTKLIKLLTPTKRSKDVLEKGIFGPEKEEGTGPIPEILK
jgi:archaeal cell division control protein 6